MTFAKQATLNDSAEAVAYRANYLKSSAYIAGAGVPEIVATDVATSDVYFTGAKLGEAFENTTHLYTNGSGVYGTTAQEDNATLEALLRAAIAKLVDFSRVILMRSASDFDRPYPGQTAITNLLTASGGFEPAIQNLYLAGVKLVQGILQGWNETFKLGVVPDNYVGDIFGSLGGTPDFGLGTDFGNNPVATKTRKRGLGSRRRAS